VVSEEVKAGAPSQSRSRQLTRRCLCVAPAQGDMEKCLAAAALNGVDRRSLQRSARLGQEVLERARRRAVDWHSQERPRGSTGDLFQPGPGPQRLLPGEVRRVLQTPSLPGRSLDGPRPWREDGKHQDREWKSPLKTVLLTHSRYLKKKSYMLPSDIRRNPANLFFRSWINCTLC
jgi:hypothetical protein